MVLRALIFSATLATLAALTGAAPPKIDASDPRLERVGGVLSLAERPFTGRIETRDRNGAVVATASYVDGLRDGTAYRLYRSGELQSVRGYQRGKKHGRQTGYWPDGSLRFSLHRG